MPVEASGFTLMILGATATVAAIAGQLNLAGVAEFPLMSSRALRAALFVVGGFFFIVGLSLIDRAGTTSSGAAPDPAPSSSTTTAPPNDRPLSPSTSTSNTPHTDKPSPTPYAELANAACAAAAEQAQALPELPTNATDDQRVMHTLTWADNVAILWNGLANVSGGVPEDHDTLLFKLGLYHDNLEDAAFGLRAGDGYTFDNNIDQVESLAFDYNRVARALDLRACVISN